MNEQLDELPAALRRRLDEMAVQIGHGVGGTTGADAVSYTHLTLPTT